MRREGRQILSHQAPVLEPRDTHLALRGLFPHPWVASTQENPESYGGGQFSDQVGHFELGPVVSCPGLFILSNASP